MDSALYYGLNEIAYAETIVVLASGPKCTIGKSAI
jgi:hypothetical protein